MDTPSTDREREHLLGADQRAPKRNQRRNDKVGVMLGWSSTLAAALNFGVFLIGWVEYEPMIYVWSILVTLGFAGWVTADSPRPRQYAALALYISFIPFLYAMLVMFQRILGLSD